MSRSIKVKIIKETSSTVTVHFMTLNRKMPVPRKDFEERVENGLYEVIDLTEEEEPEEEETEPETEKEKE